MKKRLVTLFVAAAAASLTFGTFGSASAEEVCTDVGCASVAEGDYILVLDGAEGNPDPADGYISVDGAGTVCAEDEGSPGDEGGSPTCSA
jgi:hypothetical protein